MLRIIASQYLAVLILGFANSATIQSVIAIERPVMYRERAAGERSSVFWTGSWCLWLDSESCLRPPTKAAAPLGRRPPDR